MIAIMPATAPRISHDLGILMFLLCVAWVPSLLNSHHGDLVSNQGFCTSQGTS